MVLKTLNKKIDLKALVHDKSLTKEEKDDIKLFLTLAKHGAFNFVKDEPDIYTGDDVIERLE